MDSLVWVHIRTYAYTWMRGVRTILGDSRAEEYRLRVC
jgi:hypothetical protein